MTFRKKNMGYLLHWLEGFPADNDSRDDHMAFRMTAKRDYAARKAARERWAAVPDLEDLFSLERWWNDEKQVEEPPQLS